MTKSSQGFSTPEGLFDGLLDEAFPIGVKSETSSIFFRFLKRDNRDETLND
jgi:GH24 family phage-related lysozyme (muramidase)